MLRIALIMGAVVVIVCSVVFGKDMAAMKEWGENYQDFGLTMISAIKHRPFRN